MYQHPPTYRKTFWLPLLSLLTASSVLGIGLQSANAQLATPLNFDPPPMSTPGNREAGALRSDTCADTANASGIMALVPDTNVGLTAAASPDLFAYIPPNNAEKAELRVFKEATGEEVYAGEFTLPENGTSTDYPYGASVVKLPLSATPVALEPGESYLWAVFVVCDSTNRAQDMVVDVVVQQADENYFRTLSTDVKAQLDTLTTASSEDKVLTYGAAGLWQDLLSELSSDPTAYGEVWAKLLTDQGMGAIADAPIYTTTLTPIAP